MAVPGPVTSAMSLGTHLMLREPDTVLVTRAEEVVEAIGRIGEDLCPPLPGLAGTRPTDGLSATALRVHEALPRRGERRPQALSVESGVPEELVRAVLPELLRQRLVERGPGGWRRVSQEPP